MKYLLYRFGWLLVGLGNKMCLPYWNYERETRKQRDKQIAVGLCSSSKFDCLDDGSYENMDVDPIERDERPFQSSGIDPMTGLGIRNKEAGSYVDLRSEGVTT